MLCSIKVEVELGIKTSGANYYVPRGEQIAQSVDGLTSGGMSGEKAGNYYTRWG